MIIVKRDLFQFKMILFLLFHINKVIHHELCDFQIGEAGASSYSFGLRYKNTQKIIFNENLMILSWKLMFLPTKRTHKFGKISSGYKVVNSDRWMVKLKNLKSRGASSYTLWGKFVQCHIIANYDK